MRDKMTTAMPHWERVALTRNGKYLTDIEAGFIMGNIGKCKNVLDIGSGGGKFTRMLLAKGIHVVSLDLNLSALHWLKMKSKDAVIVAGSSEMLPFRDNAFDGAIMIETLDYALSATKALSELRRALKMGSKAIFSFGNASSLKSRLKRLRKDIMQDRFTANEIFGLLSSLRLGFEKAEGYNWMLFKRESECGAIPAVARIVKLCRLGKLVAASPWIIVSIVTC